MPIVSPKYSFVDFNNTNIDCRGNNRDVALPVYNNLGIKYQIKIEDEFIEPGVILKAAVCSESCELIYNPDYEIIKTCNRYTWIEEGPGTSLTAEQFPIEVGNYAPAPGQPQVPAGIYDLSAFLNIISETYATSIQGLDFITCCPPPVISDIVVFYNATGVAHNIELHAYWGYGYVNFPATDMNGIIDLDECFRYCIINNGNEVLECSNLFYRINDPCYTTLFNYYNEENGYDFKYVIYDDNGVDRITENQIRLFVSFDYPTYPIEENIFRQSNKIQQRLSTLIEKEWQGETSPLSHIQHDRLVILLKHDYLHVEYNNMEIDRRMTQIGAYEPVFPEQKHYPVYPANFKIRDYLNSYTNNNCGFNCGLELITDCEDDGGVTPPCPEKYSIEFVVGAPGSPVIDGQTTYQDDNLIGMTDIEIYREGLLQHKTGSNFYQFASATGTITVTPPFYQNERIAIWEV